MSRFGDSHGCVRAADSQPWLSPKRLRISERGAAEHPVVFEVITLAQIDTSLLVVIDERGTRIENSRIELSIVGMLHWTVDTRRIHSRRCCRKRTTRAALDERQPHPIWADTQRRRFHIFLKVVRMERSHVKGKRGEGHKHAGDPNRKNGPADHLSVDVELHFVLGQDFRDDAANDEAYRTNSNHTAMKSIKAP